MLPKERREVTLVRAPHLGSDLAQGQVGLEQQPLRGRHPAGDHILVGRPPGGLLEPAGKVGRARLCHGGNDRGRQDTQFGSVDEAWIESQIESQNDLHNETHKSQPKR